MLKAACLLNLPTPLECPSYQDQHAVLHCHLEHGLGTAAHTPAMPYPSSCGGPCGPVLLQQLLPVLEQSQLLWEQPAMLHWQLLQDLPQGRLHRIHLQGHQVYMAAGKKSCISLRRNVQHA